MLPASLGEETNWSHLSLSSEAQNVEVKKTYKDTEIIKQKERIPRSLFISPY